MKKFEWEKERFTKESIVRAMVARPDWSVRRICAHWREHGGKNCWPSTITRWRKADELFASRYAAVLADRYVSSEDLEASPTGGPPATISREEQMARFFLIRLQDRVSQTAALRETSEEYGEPGLTMARVRSWGSRFPFFSPAYASRLETRVVQVEDGLFETALDRGHQGHVSASKTVLQANHPAYSPRSETPPRGRDPLPDAEVERAYMELVQGINLTSPEVAEP